MSRANYRKGVMTNSEMEAAQQRKKLATMNSAKAAKDSSEEKDDPSGFKRLLAATGQVASDRASAAADTDTGSGDSDAQAWKQIGDGAADIAKTWKEKRAAKKASES